MPIQNEVLNILQAGRAAVGLYKLSPAAKLEAEFKKEEAGVKSMFANEAEHSARLQEQAAAEESSTAANRLFAQSGEQSYAASEAYYNLAQRASGSKQIQLLAKSQEAAERAAGTAELLSKQQNMLMLARAAVMGDKQYADIRSYVFEGDKLLGYNERTGPRTPREKPKAEEKK